MNRKDYVRILRKILAIVIIFSMLQGHVGVIGTFGHVAYAAIESSLEEVFEETTSVEVENVVTEETPVVEDEEEFNQSLTTEEPEKVTEEKTEEITEEVQDSIVENTILENVTSNPVIPEENEVTESEAEEEEEIVAEEEEEVEVVEEVETLNSEINIVNSYRYLDGVVVRVEFNNSLTNLKHVVESLKVNISKPKAEGYILDQIYVEKLDLASDDSVYNYYETANGITIDVSGEDAIDECNHKYTIVYVFKGEGEIKNLSFDIDAHLTYKDLVEEEYFSSISSEITEEVEETEETTEESEEIAEETKTIELVQKHFGKEAVQMLQMFQGLNKVGKTKMLEDLSDLTELSKYTEKGDCPALKNA